MKYLVKWMMFFISTQLFAINDTITVRAMVSEATVFFSGASLAREATVNLKKGKQLLVFEKLPVDVDPESVQVASIPNGQILYVKHEEYVSKGDIAFYDKLKSTRETIELAIRHLKNEVEILAIEEKVLMDNSIIQRGEEGVAINDLREAADFYRSRLTNIRKKSLEAKEAIKGKEAELQTALLALNKYKGETEKQYSRVLVSVHSSKEQSIPLKLQYFTDNAGWSPQYDFRVEELNKPLRIVHQANVFQTTGEPWKNVQLKLAAGMPSLSNQKPEFSEWIVYENNPYVNTQLKRIRSKKGILQGVVIDGDTNEGLPFANVVLKGTNRGSVTDYDGIFAIKPIEDGWHDLEVSFIGYDSTRKTVRVYNGTSSVERIVLNPSTVELAEVAMVNVSSIASIDKKYVSKRGGTSGLYSEQISFVPHKLKEQLNHLEYEIELPYTILSDTEEQQIRIKEVAVAASYEYHAVPRLDRDVFLMAKIPNWNRLQLLSAPINIYNKGTYSGSAYVDSNFSEDTLEVSLGRDQQIFVQQNLVREKNDKRIFGSNIKETIAWEIILKNNKEIPIRIIVEDQHPISEHKSIAMEFEIPEEVIHNEEKGILRWELDLNAGDKKQLNYQYSIKYDKKLSLDF